MAFKTYDCKLRLGGSVLNEIRKTDVTAAEIEVYRMLHGADAVLDIVEKGKVERSDAAERQRIYDTFANPASTLADALQKKMRMLRDLFGHDRNPMPKSLDDGSAAMAAVPDNPDADDGAVEEPVKPKIKRTKAAEVAAFAD